MGETAVASCDGAPTKAEEFGGPGGGLDGAVIVCPERDPNGLPAAPPNGDPVPPPPFIRLYKTQGDKTDITTPPLEDESRSRPRPSR